MIVRMTIRLGTHVSPTVTSDTTTFQPCTQQQVTSGNELLLVIYSLDSICLTVLLMTIRLGTHFSPTKAVSALQTGFNAHSMRIQESGLNLLPIHFNRVRTIVLPCEFDTTCTHAALTDSCDCHIIRKKTIRDLVFVSVFVSLCYWQLCATLRKSRRKRERLMWKRQQTRDRV